MLKLTYTKGNVHHRSAIISAAQKFNSQFHKDIEVVIGTRQIIGYLFRLSSVFSKSSHVIFYFAGFGRLYTDYGSAGRVLFNSIVLLCSLRSKVSFIVESEADRIEISKLTKRNIVRVYGSGFFYELSSRKEIVLRRKNREVRRIVYVSRFGVSKHTDQILNLFSTIPEDVKINIVGYDISGNKYSKLFTHAATKYPNVTFHGRVEDQNDIQSIIKKGDVLVYPTKREGCPFTALESINAGTLPILTRSPGSEELAQELALPTIEEKDFSNYFILNDVFLNFFGDRFEKEVDLESLSRYGFAAVEKQYFELFVAIC